MLSKKKRLLRVPLLTMFFAMFTALMSVCALAIDIPKQSSSDSDLTFEEVDMEDSEAESRTSENFDVLLQRLKFFDEILTQSLRNYAFTEDEKWLKRYFDYQPKLDSVINAVRTEYDYESSEFKEFQKSNDALYRLESEAVRLVKNGKSKDAIGTLEGKDYSKYKQIFHEMIDRKFGYLSGESDVFFSLSPSEREWLKKHPVIRVQNEKNFYPYNFNEGKPKGHSVEYIQLLEKAIGVRFEFVPNMLWSEAMDALKTKELDVIVNIVESEERSKSMSFTQSYLHTFNGIYIKEGSKRYPSLSDLKGKIVSVTRGFIEQELLENNYPEINLLLVNSPTETIEAVLTGEADATLSETAQINYLVRNQSMIGIELSAVIPDENFQNKFHLAVRKDWPEFRSILDKAMSSIKRSQKDLLFEKWIAISDIEDWVERNLTNEEMQWLNENRTWRIGIDPLAQPFEFSDEKSKHRGISSEYINYVANLLKVELNYVSNLTWNEVLAKTKTKEIDVLPLAVGTESRQSFLNFTESYLEYPPAIVTRDSDESIGSQSDLANRRVAIIKNYPVTEIILREQSDIQPVMVDNVLDALKAVSSGQADAFIMGAATVTYQIRESNIANLKIAAYANFEIPGYSIATRKGWEPLVGILNKVLKDISLDKKIEFNNRWIELIDVPSTKSDVVLSKPEQAWIAANPVIRVMSNSGFIPFDFELGGRTVGYSIDYVKLLADRVGLELDYVKGSLDSQLMKMKDQEVDFLHSITDSDPERHEYLVYTRPYKTAFNAIIVRSESNNISSIENLRGLTVALIKGDPFSQYLDKNVRNVSYIFLDSYEAMLKAVAFGRVDAAKIELPVATYLMRQLSLTNLRVAGQIREGEDFSQEYRLAIRKDWPILHSILDKAMNSITQQDLDELDRKWLTSSSESNVEFNISPTVTSSRDLVLLILGILVGAVLLLLVFRLLEKSKRDPLQFRFSGSFVKRMAFLFNAVVISIVLLLSWWALNGLREKITRDILTSLQAVLETTEKATTFWAIDKQNSLSLTASNTQFRELTNSLMSLHDDNKLIVNSDELTEIRNIYQQTRSHYNPLGFYIIATDGMSVASLSDADIDSQNIIAVKRPDLFKRVLTGETLFIPPIFSEASKKGLNTNSTRIKSPTMFFATPIRSLDGMIIGVLAERYDPHGDFSRIHQSGRIGASGETYSISRNGQMLSESRFLEQLVDLGLVNRGEQSILSVELRDPGEHFIGVSSKDNLKSSQPLTRMAKELSQGNSGYDIDGYRDYRGVKVIGVWAWNESLGIGMTTEIDHAEAYQGYSQTRFVIVVILLVTISASIILTLVTMLLGSRANRELQSAHDLLEKRVLDRTQDLELSQEHLRSSEFRLQTVMDSVPAIMLLKDIDGKYLLINSYYEEVFGVKKEDALGKTDADLFPKELSDISMSLDDYVMSKGVSKSFEDKVPHTNGQMHHYLATKVAIRDEKGDVNGLAAVALDITERKEMEEKLKHILNALHLSEERFELAMKGAKDGLWDWDYSTGGIYYSDRVGEILGFEPGGLAPTLEAWSALCSEEDVARNIELVERCIRGEQEGFFIEYLMRHKLGHWVPVQSRAYAARDPKTQLVTRFVGTLRDLTEQREQEQELKNAIELANAANKAKSEFLATMSHEIRTPLNGVLGMLSLLNHTELNVEQGRKVNIAMKSAESLLSIINDILDFSKIEAGKLELESVDFNLSGVLEELAQTMAFKADEKDIELVLDITQVNTHWVMGDPSRIRQVLINLIGNAIKFTEHGEIVVRASLETKSDKELTLSCSVKDSGIGISEEKIATLFQSFTQADTSTTRKYGGSGLGLAICKKLVELMGGSIDVHSESGKGSSFNFDITLLKATTQPTSFPKIDMSKLRILIVDDNVTNREIFSTLLQLWGAKTSEVSSAQEALALCSSANAELYDIALVDMHMPEMNGEMLAKEIRKLSHLDSMKLLLLTSMSKQKSNDDIKKLGFDGYLSKPVASSDLFNAVTALMLQAKQITDPQLVTEAVLGQFQTTIPSSELVTNVTWPSDLRILLVEDNQINQLVVKGMLEMLGLTCDFAGNGLEAIVSLKRAPEDVPYTLIFMDCQMPELDGYEATKRIRSGSAGSRYLDVTIVAMTAHAMKDELDKCLSVGMNDYLSKPLDELKLKQTLIKWTQNEASPDGSQAGPTEADRGAGNLTGKLSQNDESGGNFNTSNRVWDEDALLKRLSGNRQLVRELMDLFTLRMPEKLSELETAVSTEDKQKIKDIAHAIKGMAGNLSADKLKELAFQLEQNVLRMAFDDIKQKLIDISQAADSVTKELKRGIDDELKVSGKKEPLDAKVVKAWLSELQERLEEGEFMTTECFSEVEHFEFNEEMTTLLSELKQHISVFDMDVALETAKKLELRL